MAEYIGVRNTTGVIGGETIQIVEGRWPDEVGDGLALTDVGLDLIEPCLRTACSDWTSEHRYGAFELPPSTRSSLVRLLQSEAARLTEGDGTRPQEAKLLTDVADWLDARSVTVPISILGY